MSQSGDRKPEDPTPVSPSDHDDDLIGFASPRALEGQLRSRPTPSEPEYEPAPEPARYEDADLFEPAPVIRPSWGAPQPAEPKPEPEPEPVEIAAPEPEPEPEPLRLTPEPEPERPASWPEPAVDPRLDFDTPPAPRIEPRVAPDYAPEPIAAAPRWSPADVRRSAAPSRSVTSHHTAEVEEAEGQGGLFTLYALILLIVPTLGVAGAIGLFAVLGRSLPSQPLARSHHIYQKRTLMIAAGVAVAGVFLMAAPFALGVISLFGIAVWVIVRGAFGLWRLKAGRPISNPRGLWI